jgi:hypothetical protein
MPSPDTDYDDVDDRWEGARDGKSRQRVLRKIFGVDDLEVSRNKAMIRLGVSDKKRVRFPCCMRARQYSCCPPKVRHAHTARQTTDAIGRFFIRPTPKSLATTDHRYQIATSKPVPFFFGREGGVDLSKARTMGAA